MNRVLRTMGWAGVLVGAAALAGGIWAVSADGDEIACTVEQRDDLGHCPTLRSTRVLGAVLTGIGAASATLGGVWLYLGQGRGPRAEGTPSSVALGFSGRF